MRSRRLVAGVLAATVLLQVTTAPAALAATVCNRYCDGRDPGLSPGDRVAATTTLYGRSFQVHVDDTDAMAWGGVGGGQPGDQVWLDRSFDGGRTWAAGSRLGDTTVPTGATGTRTRMVNVDDWATRGVGVLRACGKAGDRPELTCTGWVRSTWNAADRRTAAATALMTRFDQGTGLFDTGWWTGANALTALIDTSRVSGMHSYDYAIAATYDRNVNARLGQFRNEYLDDTGWWGLAWVARTTAPATAATWTRPAPTPSTCRRTGTPAAAAGSTGAPTGR